MDDEIQRPEIQRLLNNLGRAIVQAISSSSDVGEAVRKVRREGYALNLALNCTQDESLSSRIELTPRRPGDASEPTFRLDCNDVAFLKSVGIDATRAARRRR